MTTDDRKKPIHHINDAQDRLGNAHDMTEIVRMAHCKDADEEGNAVCTALMFAQDCLREARECLELAKDKIDPNRWKPGMDAAAA